MLNAHSRVGVAQIALFAPAAILATYLLLIRHGKPRMAWWFLFIFSSIRVGGGVTVVLLENDLSSTGLIVATILLLGVGIIPLMLVTIGLLRIVLAEDFEDKRIFHIIIYVIRTLFFVRIALIVAGGSLEGQYKDTSDVSIGLKLVKVGYIVVALILAILVAFQSYLWSHKRGMSETSLTILKGTSAAIPFLVIRIAYAFLSVFDTNPKWKDLSGPSLRSSAWRCSWNSSWLQSILLLVLASHGSGITSVSGRMQGEGGSEEWKRERLVQARRTDLRILSRRGVGSLASRIKL